MPKNFHEWIKQWIKLERLSEFQMIRSESPEFVLMYLGRCLDTSDAQKRAWPVYRTARTAFPFLARSVTCSFKRSSNASACSSFALLGVVFLHPTTTRRQAGCFMLLIVSLSNGLNRNPQPLSARRISITQGTGSVWLTTV